MNDLFESAAELYRAAKSPEERRFAARMWLSGAIQSHVNNAAPALDLLEALENLDFVEVVENIDTREEKVLYTSAVGPTQIHLEDGQHIRSIGKVDPILTLPEVSADRLVAGKDRGRRLTPPETGLQGYAVAVVDRLNRLGMPVRDGIALVEKELLLTGVGNIRKKMNSKLGNDHASEARDDEAARLRNKAKDEILTELDRLSRSLGWK